MIPSPVPSSLPPAPAGKIEPVTQIQDAIDNFSLAAFNALQEVRDVSLNDIAMSEKADEARIVSDLARRNKTAKLTADKLTATLSVDEEQVRDLALVQRVSENVMQAHDKIVEAIDDLPFKDSSLREEVGKVKLLQTEITELENEIEQEEMRGKEVLKRIELEVKRQARLRIEE